MISEELHWTEEEHCAQRKNTVRTSLISKEEDEEEEEEDEKEHTTRTSYATQEVRRTEEEEVEEEDTNEAAEELEEEDRGLSVRTFSLWKNLFAFTTNLLSVDWLSKIGLKMRFLGENSEWATRDDLIRFKVQAPIHDSASDSHHFQFFYQFNSFWPTAIRLVRFEGIVWF